jgi:hypothetical protein
MHRHLLDLARRHGPLTAGSVRAVVLEPDGRVVVRDFTSRLEADAYARDAAWETADDRGSPLVHLFASLDEPVA